MKKILLVEDTAEVLEILSDLLRMEGYHIQGAINGIDALNQLALFFSDLIITDLRMPIMDGFALLEELKKTKELATIPVLVFSANATPEIEEKSLKLGAAGFLKKPINTDILIETVKTILEV